MTKVFQNPRFFMPGFMYGRNRGGTPMSLLRKFPKIREEESFPASPYWMVRGKEKLMAASKQESGTLFSQYNGLSCQLESEQNGWNRTGAGFAIGYENAPWLFVESSTVVDRPVPKDNCFSLAPGESVSVPVYLFSYTAEKETGIYAALRHIYDTFHESPGIRPGISVGEAARDLAGAVSEAAWLSDISRYSGFVYEQPDGG